MCPAVLTVNSEWEKKSRQKIPSSPYWNVDPSQIIMFDKLWITCWSTINVETWKKKMGRQRLADKNCQLHTDPLLSTCKSGLFLKAIYAVSILISVSAGLTVTFIFSCSCWWTQSCAGQLCCSTRASAQTHAREYYGWPKFTGAKNIWPGRGSGLWRLGWTATIWQCSHTIETMPTEVSASYSYGHRWRPCLWRVESDKKWSSISQPPGQRLGCRYIYDKKISESTIQFGLRVYRWNFSNSTPPLRTVCYHTRTL
jgi:hypothetical protein